MSRTHSEAVAGATEDSSCLGASTLSSGLAETPAAFLDWASSKAVLKRPASIWRKNERSTRVSATRWQDQDESMKTKIQSARP